MERSTIPKHDEVPNSLDQQGLCLLSLDGGGVRGLSSLYVLKFIMDTLNLHRSAESRRKPCEVFDLIGGTSTGGLIAIMLGRLEMDVDECIEAYSQLAESVFHEKLHWFPATFTGKIQPRFDSAKLETAIKDVISGRNMSDTELLDNKEPRGCHVFVCTVDCDTKRIVPLRSYQPLFQPQNVPATICQAALATSAASSFFDQVSIDDRKFADGGLGANNPIDLVEQEASNIWCSPGTDLKPWVKCIVSIGTGNPGLEGVQDNVFEFLQKTLVEIATETERTATNFINRWQSHHYTNRYFRFNVEQGLQDVGMDEYEKKGPIKSATENYLGHQERISRVLACVGNLELKNTHQVDNISNVRHHDNIISERFKNKVNSCLHALYITDSNINRETIKSIKGKRVTGTCEWIRDSKEYQSWLRSDEQCLLISGGPGKGKTMLSIFLTEELEKDAEVIFCFCSRLLNRLNTEVDVLKQLIYQLIKKNNLLFKHISGYFGGPGEAEMLSSPEALWMILKKILQAPDLGTVFCVLDGLDECDQSSSELLAHKFCDLFSLENSNLSPGRFKLAIVSGSTHGPEHPSQVKLDTKHDEYIRKDIQRLISTKVKSLKADGLNDELRNIIECSLLSQANGTFLWVGLVMSELSKKRTVTEILHTLDTLPSALSLMYGRMLRQIEGDDRIISEILQWVTVACRPLTLPELTAVIRVPSSAFLSNNQALRDYITICGPIVKIHDDDETINLVHQSAQQYLLGNQVREDDVLKKYGINEQKAHFELAQTCLHYIETSCGHHKTLDTIDSLVEQTPFARYAIFCWPHHARLSSTYREDDILLSRPFLQETSAVRMKWWRIYRGNQNTVSTIDDLPLLHLASYLGIESLTRRLVLGKTGNVMPGNPTHKTDRLDRTPLHFAAAMGHKAVVKFLLPHSNVNAKDAFRRSPLTLAAIYGHEEVVQLLLPSSAINEADFLDRTPLIWAAMQGFELVVTLLLDHMKHDPQTAQCQRALKAAVRGGLDTIVLLLLPYTKDSKELCNEMLIEAASHGHEAVVQVLIPYADMNAKGCSGKTSLYSAAEGGYTAAVELLLTNHADVNLSDNYNQTPLMVASRKGYEAIVQALLRADANTQLEDEWEMTASRLASWSGHKRIEEILGQHVA